MAGIGNPYQYLMMKGLNKNKRLKVISGIDNRFIGILLTAIKQKPDYIHFDWIHSFYYRRTLWMCVLNIPLFVIQILVVKYILGVKLVWTLHNIEPHDAKFQWLHKFNRRLFAKKVSWIRVFSNMSIAKASAYLNVTPATFKVYEEGPFIEYYKNNMSREEARLTLDIKASDRVLLFFGLIKPYKGVVELIDGFVEAQLENTTLLIAGKVMNKAYGDTLKKSISNLGSKYSIKLKDAFIPHDEVQVYFNAADIVILPFKKIENSGSLILGMGFGKPIIAPNLGLVTDKLGDDCPLVYTDSFDGVLGKLERITNAELVAIGNSNFKKVKEMNWENFSQAFFI